MEQVDERDVLCGNRDCQHPRHEHLKDKRCQGRVTTERNIHGEAEGEGDECRCPYFHTHQADYREK